jgi:Tol biopolymer transport system component/DNA-binding winged helix-turn-helix (wHTH) protein
MSDEIRRPGSSIKSRDSLFVAKDTADRDRREFYEFGCFRLEPTERKLMRGNEVVVLTPKAFDTLVLLVRNSGHLLEKDELIKMLWPDSFVEEGNLSNNIFVLRKALGEDPPYIETVPKRGYRFVGALRQLPHAAAPRPEKPLEGHRQLPNKGAVAWRRPGFFVIAAIAVASALPVIGAVLGYSQPRPPTVTNMVRITNDGKAKSPMESPVTDGLYLYLVEGRPWTTGSGIAQLTAAGGETTWITTTLQEVWTIFGISPDRSGLLVANGAAVGAHVNFPELWVQPLPAGAPHRVGNINASAACWTPDGIHIVYANEHAIMITNKDGSEPHQLAKVPGVGRSIRFSPDGRRIRFNLIHPPGQDSSSIWEMDANGKNIHPLFPDWKESPYQCCGNWSPDGDYYYFQAGHGNAQAIWVMPERRSIFHRGAAGLSRLTSGPLRFGAPMPSSDGKRLFVAGEEPRVELFRYDLQTRRFDSFLPGLSAGPVDFSPDRKWMAYVSYPDMTLWRSRMDGSEKIQLTFPPMRAYEPRWSPDGSNIAFMDVPFSHPWRIRLLSLSGGSSELLTQASTEDDRAEADATWTPDGKSIIFASFKFDGNDRVNSVIYRLDLENKKFSTISDSDGLSSPRVSPDGRYISALGNGHTKLMLFDTKTNHWSSLAEGNRFDYNEWSHDGKYVYMRETWAGAGALVRVRIKDRVLEHVLSLKDFPQLTDIFAGWIGLTPDDAPLLMRDRSVQEIYALDLRFH